MSLLNVGHIMQLKGQLFIIQIIIINDKIHARVVYIYFIDACNIVQIWVTIKIFVSIFLSLFSHFE